VMNVLELTKAGPHSNPLDFENARVLVEIIQPRRMFGVRSSVQYLEKVYGSMNVVLEIPSVCLNIDVGARPRPRRR